VLHISREFSASHSFSREASFFSKALTRRFSRALQHTRSRLDHSCASLVCSPQDTEAHFPCSRSVLPLSIGPSHKPLLFQLLITYRPETSECGWERRMSGERRVTHYDSRGPTARFFHDRWSLKDSIPLLVFHRPPSNDVRAVRHRASIMWLLTLAVLAIRYKSIHHLNLGCRSIWTGTWACLSISSAVLLVQNF
jgi:hypothetical protein